MCILSCTILMFCSQNIVTSGSKIVQWFATTVKLRYNVFLGTKKNWYVIGEVRYMNREGKTLMYQTVTNVSPLILLFKSNSAIEAADCFLDCT